MTQEEIKNKAKEYAQDKYCTDGNPIPQYKIAQIHAGRDGFIDGVNWRINSVWHDVMEAPCRNKIYLVQIGEGTFDTFCDSDDWESFSKYFNFVRWAYVKDLLPNKEE